MIGKVYLVGAGPGDPELLTLRALRVLRQADAVLHDALVPASILRLAASHTAIVNVGKRCGKKSINQAEINLRMIEAARHGLTVVRLKGGDPSIFGRAGEEIEALRDAGVDFEIVPGVTAASAAAAAAGISLTHRDLASSVVFLTGHRVSRETAQVHSRIESECPAGVLGPVAGKTVVVYMPGPDYEALEAQLRAMGFPAETPCLLVSAASGGQASVHRTTVEALANAPVPAAPGILIVGKVTSLARDYSHFALASLTPPALAHPVLRDPMSPAEPAPPEH